MNFTISIFPQKHFHPNTKWSAIKNSFQVIANNLGLNPHILNFQFIDSNKEHPRSIIENILNLRLIDSSNILKLDKNVTGLKNQVDNELEKDRYITIRYVYDRRLEFTDTGNVISWRLDYGIDGLYQMDEEMFEDDIHNRLSDSQKENFKNALNKYQFVFRLETDIYEPGFNPIFPLAIVFCQLVNGIAFIEHSHKDIIPNSGYWTSEELIAFVRELSE